jgi:hypothetical protein
MASGAIRVGCLADFEVVDTMAILDRVEMALVVSLVHLDR